MIELRWVDRKVKDVHPLTNVAYGHPRETVLQYRQRMQIKIGVGGKWEFTDHWSDWMDVPTVKEEEYKIEPQEETK